MLKIRAGSLSNLNRSTSQILQRPKKTTTSNVLFTYVSIIIATFSQSLLPLTILLSSTSSQNESDINSNNSAIPLSYQCSSAIVMSELSKLIISILVVFYEFNFDVPTTMEIMLFEVFQVHTFAIPGVFYALSAVLTIKMVSEIGVLYIYYSLIFQIILTTAIWKLFFFQKVVTNKQWLSLLLLLISTLFLSFEYYDSWSYFPSMVLFSNDDDDGEHTFDNNDANNDGNARNLLIGRSTDNSFYYSIFRNYWLLFLFIESLSKSIASVVAEYKYKTFEKNLSFHAQSSSQYLWSFVIGSVLFYMANIKEASKELLLLNLTYALTGFNVWTWMFVLFYTCYGFAIGYVLKYFNNIIRLLVLSSAVCFSHITIYLFSNGIVSLGALCVFSHVAVGTSVWLYVTKV